MPSILTADIDCEVKQSVLIVDDNQMNREMLIRRLSKQGHYVEQAENGRIALKHAALGSFDLILLDIMMPELNGYQVLEILKSQDSTRHIPVIMISALDEVESVVRCIELGADDYVSKPFNPTLLKARVNACLDRKKMHDKEVKYRDRIEKHNVALEERVIQQVNEITSAQLAAIFAMSKLAESRDPETGEHLERMREYCKILSYKLGTRVEYKTIINKDFVENIYAASPLHDIGKVGVPDSILRKPGRLTDEEWTIMRTHTIIGSKTLMEVNKQHPGNSLIKTGIEIAGGHHEKWDGSGYPFGLKGEEIPLVARILALGDVYDALTSKRTYKSAFTHEKSKEILLSESEGHFDPTIVEVFLEVEDDFKRIRTFYIDHEDK